jgi:hypothetical protein
MRKLLIVVMLAIMVLASPSAVKADDYITTAAEALQTSRVYIDPDSEYSSAESISRLEGVLYPDDRIVLVILPEDALVGTDMQSLVTTLSEKLGNDRIIGLAVGQELIGYAPMLDSGIAPDKMVRAANVTYDPVTGLIAFTQNMHSWMSNHPLPTATPIPTATPRPEDIARNKQNLRISLIVVICALLVGLAIVVATLRKNTVPIDSETKRYLDQSKEALSNVRTYIDNILTLATKDVRKILEEIYDIAKIEIVDEISEDPSRATAFTVQRFAMDITEFSEVLRFYSQILSKRLRLTSVDPDFQQNVEDIFFPKVKEAVQQIADELDKGDVQKLERLVRSLSNEFRTRGIK